MDRRAFLSVSFAALVLGAPDAMATSPRLSSSKPSTSPFYGNPNCTISAINGSIFLSRVSGHTPCFIHVSASSITCTGTRALGAGGACPAVPYEDLEFSWNFGDPSGQEVFIRPTDSAAVNANAQTGPEALYCYRNPGTYKISLTVRGKNGSSYTTATFTQSVTISAFTPANGVRYIDSVNGNNSWSGTLAQPNAGRTDGPWANLTSAAFTTFMSGNNKALYIAEGSNITGAAVGTGINLPQSAQGWRVGSYVGASGQGAKPLINGSTASLQLLNLGKPGGIGTLATDIVVSGITFQVSDGWSPASAGVIIGNVVAGSSTGDMTFIYLDNVDVVSTLTANNGSGYTNVSFNVNDIGGAAGTTQWWGIWGGGRSPRQSTRAAVRYLRGSSAVPLRKDSLFMA